MSFAVKRVGNFLKIKNKEVYGILNLQHTTSIRIIKDSKNKFELSTSYKSKTKFGYIDFGYVDNPKETINKICDQIEGWCKSPITVYNKKI